MNPREEFGRDKRTQSVWLLQRKISGCLVRANEPNFSPVNFEKPSHLR